MRPIAIGGQSRIGSISDLRLRGRGRIWRTGDCPLSNDYLENPIFGTMPSAHCIHTGPAAPCIDCGPKIDKLSKSKKCFKLGERFVMRCLIWPACVLATAMIPSFSSASAATGERALATALNDPALQWGPCPPIFPKGCQIAVLHGDPARPDADIFLRVPGGYRIPAHKHTSSERMVLVSGKLKVRYQGMPAAILRPGSYAFGPAGMPHNGTCLSVQPCTLFIAFDGAVDGEAFSGKL